MTTTESTPHLEIRWDGVAEVPVVGIPRAMISTGIPTFQEFMSEALDLAWQLTVVRTGLGPSGAQMVRPDGKETPLVSVPSHKPDLSDLKRTGLTARFTLRFWGEEAEALLGPAFGNDPTFDAESREVSALLTASQTCKALCLAGPQSELNFEEPEVSLNVILRKVVNQMFQIVELQARGYDELAAISVHDGRRIRIPLLPLRTFSD